jgi:hypothetical protein
MSGHGDGTQPTSEYCALPFQHHPRCPGTAPGSTLNQRENDRQSHTKWISMRRRSVDQYGRTLTEIEEQIDARVSQLWNLSDDELADIKGSLRDLGGTIGYEDDIEDDED